MARCAGKIARALSALEYADDEWASATLRHFGTGGGTQHARHSARIPVISPVRATPARGTVVAHPNPEEAVRIDVHHHYVTRELVDELARAGIDRVGGRPLGASRPEDSLEIMDRLPRSICVPGTGRRRQPSTVSLADTDYPLAQEIGVASTLAGLAGLDDDERHAIEAGNAGRLFPRLAGALVA